MTGQLILFCVLAVIALTCAVALILQDNPVRSALYLVLVLFSVAILFLMLHATFIALVQVIVYAGAIMVLFIFVIMLLNLGTPEVIRDNLRPQQFFGPAVGVVVAGLLTAVLAAGAAAPQSLPDTLTGPTEIGLALFSPDWLFPFEVVSILLLVAAIGAVMLAKKRI